VNGDTSLRVLPPVVAVGAATARGAGQNAVLARTGLVTLPSAARFTPGAGAAVARLRSAWLAELERLAVAAAALGDAAEAAADDYVRTDRLAMAAAPAG
jgi:hypothetical protein